MRGLGAHFHFHEFRIENGIERMRDEAHVEKEEEREKKKRNETVSSFIIRIVLSQ